MAFEDDARKANELADRLRDHNECLQAANLIGSNDPDASIWVRVEGEGLIAPLRVVRAMLALVKDDIEKRMGEVGAVVVE